MGRYSLYAPGLMFARSGNDDFVPSLYATLEADDDGTFPLTDTEFFADDACKGVSEHVSKAWDTSDIEASLTCKAEYPAPEKRESCCDTIRRCLNDRSRRNHLQDYKERTRYWIFSAGKPKAFHCLVYLHRDNEETLSPMRSEYVIPLQGKLAARLDKRKGDLEAATSTTQGKRLTKERTKLGKQQVELLAYDENLGHDVDRRIALALDDGVKVNYGKFSDLLAEVKGVHGKKPAAG